MTENVIITVTARKKMVQARAGDIVLPKLVGMAFGNGGVDASGNVVAPTEDQTELKSELFRKAVDGHSYPSETTCRYECMLTEAELAGEKISEIGLYDADGDLACIKTFTEKGKDADLEMTFTLDDVF
ncbi:MAG: phage tail protein [Oscillospiraceae bacterium]|nr:phage tail protein [Oscillospiraceae bacterium]